MTLAPQGAPSRIPAFKPLMITIGVLYVLMASSILLRDVGESLGPFGLPQATLDSPHFQDAIIWVYFHMTVLGGAFIVVGFKSRTLSFQRAFVRFCFVAHLGYVYLDVRSSDTALGIALYKGPASAVPAVIAAIFLLCFAALSLLPARSGQADS